MFESLCSKKGTIYMLHQQSILRSSHPSAGRGASSTQTTLSKRMSGCRLFRQSKVFLSFLGRFSGEHTKPVYTNPVLTVRFSVSVLAPSTYEVCGGGK